MNADRRSPPEGGRKRLKQLDAEIQAESDRGRPIARQGDVAGCVNWSTARERRGR